MFSNIWFLVLNLTWFCLVNGHNLRDVRAVSAKNHKQECVQYYVTLIQNSAARTRIRPSSSTEIEYCVDNERHKRFIFQNAVDITAIINIYESLPQVNSYQDLDPNSPVVTYGTLPVGNNAEIPVYIEADIRHRHLPGPNTRQRFRFGPDVADQMNVMGMRPTDERGHLLSHALGGSWRAINIAPMARNVNRHYEAHEIDNRELGIPRSYWRSNEDWIQNFLNQYTNGRVAWRLAVQYENDVIFNAGVYDEHMSNRPVSFTLQYTAYTDQNDNNTVYYRSADITYWNDDNFVCGYEESARRKRSPETDCEVKEAKKLKGLMGEETSHGEWAERYHVSFPFAIGGKQYFYGQSIIDGRNWFIQELLPNGQMGEETDHGFWGYNYQAVFPFYINGRTFFYGSSTDTYNWFIQELLPGGKMGEETDHGNWNERYAISFSFTIGGKYYFYGQSIVDGKNWFIQELLPNGKMGAETSHGFWNENYRVAFPYMINGRQFFYGHSHDRKTWFIQELLPGGQMGEEISHGEWNEKYQVSFPFQYGGKYYFYGHSILDGRNWFIQELSPNGQMGEETSHGFWNENYSVGFSFEIGGRVYFYGHSTEKYTWFIQELL